MKILDKNLKQGYVKVLVENPDDLWYLSQIIDVHDFVRSRTTRKIKIGDSENAKSVKKPMTIEVQVDKIQYETESLRLLGKVTEGPEDVTTGSAHSLSLEIGSDLRIRKIKWLDYQVSRLEEASTDAGSRILVCVHDRETALFALVKRQGFEKISQLSGNVQKKEDGATSTGDFYEDCVKVLTEYRSRYNLEHIILASPAFFKEDLLAKVRDDDLRKIIVMATCSGVGDGAITEIMKRDELKGVLAKDRARKEIKLVEKLMANISTDGASAYGLVEVEKSVNAGAVEDLLITNAFIEKNREENTFERIEKMLNSVEQQKGRVHIIAGEHAGSDQLNGLGGIGAILRYRLNY